MNLIKDLYFGLNTELCCCLFTLDAAVARELTACAILSVCPSGLSGSLVP